MTTDVLTQETLLKILESAIKECKRDLDDMEHIYNWMHPELRVEFNQAIQRKFDMRVSTYPTAGLISMPDHSLVHQLIFDLTDAIHALNDKPDSKGRLLEFRKQLMGKMIEEQPKISLDELTQCLKESEERYWAAPALKIKNNETPH